MRALWLNRFDLSGNTEAVINWAEGVVRIRKEIKIHLVLVGIPADLFNVYEKFLGRIGLRYSLNINRQQIQNLLYYQDFDFLHVFHPDLFGISKELGSSFHIPWLANVFEEERHVHFNLLHTANCIICCHSPALQAVKDYFYPYSKQNIFLIPQGVKVKPPDFSPSSSLNILYAGPLEESHAASFQALRRTAQNLPSCFFAVTSRRNLFFPNVKYHPWNPDFSDFLAPYNIVAGFGYFLLQGIAAGKIALILEEGYGGIFSPLRQKQVPDFKARRHKESDPSIPKRLKQDLQKLHNNSPEMIRIQHDNWNYARENHDLEIVAEKMARLYSYL